MSEETSQEQPDARSFEERVFARFDAIDARLDSLEQRVDARAHDTMPIWEQALAAITETRQETSASLRNVERQIGILSKDIVQLRADVSDLSSRFEIKP